MLQLLGHYQSGRIGEQDNMGARHTDEADLLACVGLVELIQAPSQLDNLLSMNDNVASLSLWELIIHSS